jgi:hypothetical protein
MHNQEQIKSIFVKNCHFVPYFPFLDSNKNRFKGKGTNKVQILSKNTEK